MTKLGYSGCMTTAAQFPDMTTAFLKALASPARQQILMLFARGQTLTVGQVAEACDIAPSTASEQLAALRSAGLLVSMKQGKSVEYRPNVEGLRSHLETLESYLGKCCPPLDIE